MRAALALSVRLFAADSQDWKASYILVPPMIVSIIYLSVQFRLTSVFNTVLRFRHLTENFWIACSPCPQ